MTIVYMFLLASCGGAEAEQVMVPASAQAGDLVDLQACKYGSGIMDYKANCSTLIVDVN